MQDDALRRALVDALRRSLSELREAGVTPRLFGIFTTDLAEYALGLSADGVDPFTDPPSAEPPFGQHEDGYDEVGALLNARPDPYDMTGAGEREVEARFAIFRDALRTLDDEGAFGRGVERERVVLVVWWGDQSDRSRLEEAKHLNPEAALVPLEMTLHIREPSVALCGTLGPSVYQVAQIGYAGGVLAAVGSGGDVMAFRHPPGELLVHRRLRGACWALASSDDGETLFVSEGPRVCRMRAVDAAPIEEVWVASDQVRALARAGELLLVHDWSRTLSAIRIDDGSRAWSVDTETDGLAASPDGTRVAIAGGRLAMLDAATGEARTSIELSAGYDGGYTLAFSPDGRRIAVAREWRDAGIELVSVEDGSLLATLQPPDRDGCAGLAFSPDTSRLAEASLGGEVRVWDLAARRCIAEMNGRQESMCGGVVWLDDATLGAAGRDVDHGPAISLFDVRRALAET